MKLCKYTLQNTKQQVIQAIIIVVVQRDDATIPQFCILLESLLE